MTLDEEWIHPFRCTGSEFFRGKEGICRKKQHAGYIGWF
jgi:hypothetical protein